MDWWFSSAGYTFLYLVFALVAVASIRGLKEPNERGNWNAEVATIVGLAAVMVVWVLTRP